MERRFAVHAGAYRKALSALLAAALVAIVPVSNAGAAPKKPEAKAAFERGVAAYQKGDYDGASDELGRSFSLEPDIETLFAWAQTERQLERCDTASELYRKLLTYDLPAENKAAIRKKVAECETIMAKASPPAGPVTAPPPPSETPTIVAAADPPERSSRARWKDPVGGTLVVLGLAGLGVGATMLVTASSADKDKAGAPSYREFQELEDKAEARGKLGVISASVGGVLLGAGIIWYATHGGGERKTQVTGWLSRSGGGVAALGRF